MGVNWAAGLIRWKPHIGADGTPYPLHHLHPFRMLYELPGKSCASDTDAASACCVRVAHFYAPTDRRR